MHYHPTDQARQRYRLTEPAIASMFGIMDEVRPRAACVRPVDFCMRVHAETRLAGDAREKLIATWSEIYHAACR